MSEMTPRERVAATYSLTEPDRVPKYFRATTTAMETILSRLDGQDPRDYFDTETRGVQFNPPAIIPDFSRYLPPNLPENTQIDEWGFTRIPGPFYHFEEYVYVMADMNSPSELDNYPFPDYTEPYRSEGVREKIEEHHAAGYFVSGGGASLFERAWYLRGMEQMFIDWSVNPDFANKLLDKITQVGIQSITVMVSAGVDSVAVGGDVGTQRAMMISPKDWRRWIKPRTAEMIEVARSINPHVFATFHSDGYIEPIIPDLIEIGVNVINPVQPECMDPAEIKRKYGDRIALSGTIGTQTTMPFGTPDEVRRVVKERIETLAQGGGLILGPTHDFEPEVPWENIVALYEAITEYGKYD